MQRHPLRVSTSLTRLILRSSATLTVVCLLGNPQAGESQRRANSQDVTRRIVLGFARPSSIYALTVSVRNPEQIQGNNSVRVSVADAAGTVAEKWLHAADLDFYLTLRPRAAGPASVTLTAPPPTKIPEISVAFRRISMAPSPVKAGAGALRRSAEPAVIAALPNSTWQTAQTLEFGQTVFGSGDERPYAPAPVEDAYAAMVKGFQWFRFTFHGSEPRLAFFVLDVTDRDVPLDVDIFQLGKDAAGHPDVVPYTEGQFVYQIEATQNYPGLYKFRTRLVRPGATYYVRVAANHPAYQLRTFDYPIPPYRDPRLAVRTGMDFLVNMGDSWLSNTPRRGAIALRTSMPHSETHFCIACHPAQFTTRGYLTAIANGYPPVQRPALEFLTDRIYNNARPLYGEPGANWVRIIYSARTVASRLPVITHLMESNVTHDAPRPEFDLAYGNFLKVHYKDRKEMPGNETDGCEPDISPFEIAMQSWQTFGLLDEQTRDPQWLAQRDAVEHLAVAYKPQNLIDLNWKITFLATLGREKYAKGLDELIEQLYTYQQSDGEWPYPFDKQGKPADFITYHAIYALATAGRRPETDARLARAVEYCLRSQRPEGSWEGDPVYQGFNTPFRATQFAVMALSTLYPGSTRAKDWGAAFPPPPTRLATNDLPRLLDQLDQFWDLAPRPVRAQIRRVLATSDQPLAREAAARALGHMADPDAIEVLIRALGDPSKMVQRTAAWSLRQILTRRETEIGKQPARAAVPPGGIAAALRSPDARTRWGATRLFNQHFKYLTGDPALLEALTRDLNDSVPLVRFQAADALWQWYYWQVDRQPTRTGILEALARRLNTETHPLVRRGLEESVYDLLDENTGYLTAWVRSAATPEDQERITKGYEEVVRDQAQVLARVLHAATPLGREGILNAMWDFHSRHMALPPVNKETVAISLPKVLTQYASGVPDLHRPGYEYPPYRETVNFRYDPRNGFYQTRVGNDSDLIHFFSSSGPELEEALLACLRGADSDMKIEVLKAGSTLSGAGDARFAEAALELALDPDPQVREAVRYVYENGQRGILNISSPAHSPSGEGHALGSRGESVAKPGAPDPGLVKTVVEVLERGDLNGQAVALPLLAALPRDSGWTRHPEVESAVRALLVREPHPSNYAQVLAAASSFEGLMREPALRDRILAGLNDPDPAVERAGVQITLERFLDAAETAPLVEAAFAKLSSPARNILIEQVNDPKFMRRHAGISGGALSQDQAYFLGERYSYTPPDFLAKPPVLETVIASLSDPDANVRAAALDLLRKSKEIERNPKFHARILRLQNDPNPRLQLIAANVLGGNKLSEALADVKPGKLLDFNFFVARVEPILSKPGADGKACVICHASHAIFRLRPPNEQGVFSTQDSEENFKYALRVVDISNPEHSLMLIKPTRPTEGSANVADYYATHNGGQRWPENQLSPEYKTILEWLRGARLEAAKP